MAHPTIKAVITSLSDQEYPAPVCLSLLLAFNASLTRVKLPADFSSLGKMSWEGERRVEKVFRSLIQKHGVNASILFLTTSVNCISDSPTHSTFLLCVSWKELRPDCDILVL